MITAAGVGSGIDVESIITSLMELERQPIEALNNRRETLDVELSAMGSVKRHLFVDKYQKESAYDDHPLPISEGQTISQPYIVALMTEALELDAGDKVLEIGTGSGYQAAILAERSGRYYARTTTPDGEPQKFGNAILSRWPIQSS